jgi:hypothetical protein
VKTVRIGCGAGFSGDRIEPAVELATEGDLDYLIFECLAERTIALAQQARARDPREGYDPWLRERLEAVLPTCLAHGVTIVTNMGAANPPAAASVAADVARHVGGRGLRIATISGDDVLDIVADGDFTIAETGEPVRGIADRLLSANAYLGAEPIVAALADAAGIVITGRVADPSLFVAPLVHEFGWAIDDWVSLGRGTLVGHLLECAGQVTGGYFADPGRKDVHGLERLGFPIAEVPERGPITITKVRGSGGRVTPATCKEQLLYEIHDPAAYVTPDVVADFSHVRIADEGDDRVALDGAAGRRRPDRVKVSLGYRDGYIGEGQISYAGSGAVARGKLAARIVADRLRAAGMAQADIQCDLIGINALYAAEVAARHGGDAVPDEVRVRVAARAASGDAARRVGREVEALYTNGPAGGGGATAAVREVLSVASTFVPRALLSWAVHMDEVA